MSESGTQLNGSNDSGVEAKPVKTSMNSQQVNTSASIGSSTSDQNQSVCEQNSSSSNNSSNVSISATLVTNHSEPRNVLTSVSTPMASPVVSSVMATQGSTQVHNTQNQLIMSSSQPQMVSTSQTGHLNVTNAIIGQTLTSSLPSISSANGQTVHIAHPSQQHTPILHTSVQTQPNQMNVQMSQLPQVQVIQQQIGGSPGHYQLHNVYPQQMILPGNLTIQNMQFGTQSQGLSLQIPFTATNAVSSGSMPISSIAAKPPIMSKGVAISPINHSQHQMISPMKSNIGHANAQQILRHVLPAQQYVPHSSNQTVVISQLLTNQNQHSIQQSILPANNNKALMDTPKGKPFMLSHSGSIQPKSPILPASSGMSSISIANSPFRTPFAPNGTQLIATQTPSGLITNQPQILGSFQTLPNTGLTWATPQSTHLVAQNGSPIFIRAPGQSGEHMYIQTSSPQMQTLSMGTPINVHSSGTTMHMNAGQTHTTQMSASPMTATLQHISMANNVNTSTTTTVTSNTNQPTHIVPAPVVSSASKQRNIRPMNSMGTQTASSTQTQKQHPESSTSTSTSHKPIAPAKPKTNSQTTPNSTKTVTKEQNTTPSRTASVAAATTQTNSQQTHQMNKSELTTQVTKVSVGTETTKVTCQVTSTRNTPTDANKASNVKTSVQTHASTTTDSTHTKPNSTALEPKQVVKRHVEKKDASTEQDSDLIAKFYTQQQHNQSTQSVQSTTQTSNTIGQQNGQISLPDLTKQDVSKQPPQKAIVKPQILKHFIDNYVILESGTPFPINGVSHNSDSKSLNEEKSNNLAIDSIKSKNKNENILISNATSSRNRSGSEPHPCLNCGQKRKASTKSKRAKRFCNNMCANEYKSNPDKSVASNRLDLFNSVTGHLENSEPTKNQDMAVDPVITEVEKPSQEEKKRLKSAKKSQEVANDSIGAKNTENNINSNQRKTAPNETANERTQNSNNNSQSVGVDEPSASNPAAGVFVPTGGVDPILWTVRDVYEFVRNLDGCTEYADEFRSQEIDGQALMLLNESHLLTAMNMKLGPALKICNKIKELREQT